MSLEITEDLIAKQSPEAQAIIRLLLDRLAELEARLGKSPENSSLPPSAQHPHAKPKRPQRDGKKKKRGGQKGHQKHHRELIAPEQCNDVIPLRPDACRRCGKPLAGIDPEPIRHQVWELPEIKPIVTEYQQHCLACPGCGITTCASLPPGVPGGQSGPRLVAFTGLLMGHFRQSKRRASLFLQDLLKMPCCPSLTVKMQNQVAAALEVPYEQLKDQLGKQAQLFMDESPTKQANQKAWLWTAVAPLFAVFAIFSSRKGDALPKLLGDSFKGIINCDRAKMYWQAKRQRVVLGSSETRLSSFDRLSGQTSPTARPRFDASSQTDVSALEALQAGQDQLGNIPQAHEPGSKRNQRFAAARQVQRQQTVNWDVQRVVQTPPMVVDFRRRERHRADEQHSGACIAPGGHLPQAELRHSKRSGQSFRRTHVDSIRDLSPAKSIRIRLSDQSSHRPLLQATTPLAIAHPVNGYPPDSS